MAEHFVEFLICLGYLLVFFGSGISTIRYVLVREGARIAPASAAPAIAA
jgi:hypothetical protein